MQNQLIQFLEQKRGEHSIRHLARHLALSHAYVTDILKGRKPITWSFAARVAEKTGLEPMTAFEMAGLLPVGGRSETGIVNDLIAQTNGIQ